jgi:hypothetical protein
MSFLLFAIIFRFAFVLSKRIVTTLIFLNLNLDSDVANLILAIQVHKFK